jgi:murein DD-endopeptidase MepM/ murein hydrolase activator NlpD
MRKIFIFCIVLAALSFNMAHAAGGKVLNPKVPIGGVLIVKFDEAPKSVLFDDKPIVAFPYRDSWRAVVPIPLSTKAGIYKFTAELSDAALFQKSITVQKKTPKVIILPVPKKLKLTPKEVVKNLASANSTIQNTVGKTADITRFNAPFGLPLEDNRKISSPFGEVRKTGSERITHLGVDFDAKKGTPVVAINTGIVSDAYSDPLYGQSIIVDHGRGIYSIYLHLNEMKVKAGDAVKKGTLIGAVGNSGLSSGPHLHLSIKINGIAVDPLNFVSSFY